MSEETDKDRDPETGRFLKGGKGGPGRPKGSRSKLSEDFFKALFEDFQDNGAKVLMAMRLESPKDYAKMIASLQSKEITGEDGAELFSGLDVNIKRDPS